MIFAGSTNQKRGKEMRKQNSKKWVFMLFLVFALAVFTACDNQETEENKEDVTPQGTEQTTYDLKLYYASYSYMESGSGNHLISYECQLISDPDDIYIEVARALSSVPEGLDPKVYQTAFYDGLQIENVYAKDGTIFVDVSSEGLNGGSLEETLFIEQVVETYLHTFEKDGIDHVRFLVDGAEAETLMGHWDVSQPFGHIADGESEQQ